MFENLSVLIVGFDGYEDVWNHDIELMNKYWNDRPKTYLVNSELNPNYEDVEIINAGPNSEWSRKVQVALEKIDTPYVLLLLEDFFITDYVDNSLLEDVMKTVQKDKILFYQVLVQLINQKWEKGAPFKGNRDIKIVPRDKKYGINLQAAIWDKEYLKKVVGDGNYNAWVFEVNQLETNNYNEDRIEYLIDTRNILNITHAVVQSKYLRGAVRKLKRIGVEIPEEERSYLSVKDNFKYQFKLFMYSITPKCMVKTFKQIGRLFNIDFVTDRINTSK
ncbi:MAG: hypothetical protein J6H31_14290 [Butyrivibrio sp.]|nr:hypothetical protein [Butyrivibrio sp.]